MKIEKLKLQEHTDSTARDSPSHANLTSAWQASTRRHPVIDNWLILKTMQDYSH